MNLACENQCFRSESGPVGSAFNLSLDLGSGSTFKIRNSSPDALHISFERKIFIMIDSILSQKICNAIFYSTIFKFRSSVQNRIDFSWNIT
jgi:hypothetical protein